MSELPKGWALSSLNDLISIDGLFSDGDWIESKDQDPDGENRLLQLADIGDGVFIDKSSRFVNNEKFRLLNCTELLEGDLLIARMPDPLGRACLMPRMTQRCLTVVDVALFRAGSPEISHKLLMRFINSPAVRKIIELESSGTTRKRIARGKLSELKLPIPPVVEQTRIAQKLDELLAQVDTLKARIDAIPALLKQFRQSVLASATSGRLTEEWRAHRISREITAEQTCGDGSFPPGWKVRPLKKLVTKIEQGWSPKCESVSAGDDEWAVIKTTAIQPISFGPLENKKLPTTLLPRPELTIVIGDILITRAGPRSRAAVCCYVKATRPKLMVCDKAYRFRAVEEEFSGLLLCYFLNSPQFVRALDDLKTGISESGVNLTMKKFQDLELPQPPTEEQTEIVRRVEQFFAFADQLEAKVASAKSRIDHLTQSILAKAFRGELVPQDPNDEPASVLLERIKAQRAAAPKAKRGRKVSA